MPIGTFITHRQWTTDLDRVLYGNQHLLGLIKPRNLKIFEFVATNQIKLSKDKNRIEDGKALGATKRDLEEAQIVHPGRALQPLVKAGLIRPSSLPSRYPGRRTLLYRINPLAFYKAICSLNYLPQTESVQATLEELYSLPEIKDTLSLDIPLAVDEQHDISLRTVYEKLGKSYALNLFDDGTKHVFPLYSIGAIYLAAFLKRPVLFAMYTALQSQSETEGAQSTVVKDRALSELIAQRVKDLAIRENKEQQGQVNPHAVAEFVSKLEIHPQPSKIARPSVVKLYEGLSNKAKNRIAVLGQKLFIEYYTYLLSTEGARLIYELYKAHDENLAGEVNWHREKIIRLFVAPVELSVPLTIKPARQLLDLMKEVNEQKIYTEQ